LLFRSTCFAPPEDSCCCVAGQEQRQRVCGVRAGEGDRQLSTYGGDLHREVSAHQTRCAVCHEEVWVGVLLYFTRQNTTTEIS